MLKEAQAYSRLGTTFRTESRQALERGAEVLGQLATPSRPDHHFVFDHSKWVFYASTIYTNQGDDERAEEHSLEVLSRHTRADGTSNAPMRTGDARINLGIIHARRGDLDEAVRQGLAAFDYDRQNYDLAMRGQDLVEVLDEHYPAEPLAEQFRERLITTREAVRQYRSEQRS
ncbi:tetratricopeptide repeat protein [Spirillospora sp. CA-142024]|uniref:tetratricopeptide repeat protein n=1 Tax=Spirillospora sp. CA-142024 TaxID=3240036 RepID=UPI003D934EA1